MGKILLIEDDGTLTKDLKEQLNTLGYEVKNAYSYSSAIGLWKKYEGQFDCIILDLNINPNGLDEINTSKYFPIHGILVLKDICKGKTQEESKQIWDKTIVYSGYVDVLRKKKSDFKNYDYLKLIPKSGVSIPELLAKVKQIVK